jgi:hypothetical protein
MRRRERELMESERDGKSTYVLTIRLIQYVFIVVVV